GVTAEQAAKYDGQALGAELEMLFDEPLTEQSFFTHVSKWLEAEKDHADHIHKAAQFAAWAALAPAGVAKYRHGVLFRVPHKMDPAHLVHVETIVVDGV